MGEIRDEASALRGTWQRSVEGRTWPGNVLFQCCLLRFNRVPEGGGTRLPRSRRLFLCLEEAIFRVTVQILGQKMCVFARNGGWCGAGGRKRKLIRIHSGCRFNRSHLRGAAEHHVPWHRDGAAEQAGVWQFPAWDWGRALQMCAPSPIVLPTLAWGMLQGCISPWSWSEQAQWISSMLTHSIF